MTLLGSVRSEPDQGAADEAAAEDDSLLARAGQGDRIAFARLVQRHTPRVNALALRMLGSQSEAEDVAQDAFWRVWTTAPRWRPGEARFSTWLHRVVVNLCIDRERRRAVRRLTPLEDAPDPPDHGAGPEQQASARRELAQVLAELEKLPARQRAAILLSAEGEQSNSEIATALGTTEKAVESMLVRARRTLRARLRTDQED